MEECISIIIPVYNAEATLERCIQKIIEQSYPNWELLLVDDGSTDNSRTICNEASLKDKRIISIHKENGGVSSARNIGIEKASGEWITFCDSDDYVGPYWLQNFVELIGRKDSSELLFVQKINIFKQGIFDSVYYENKQGFISSSEFLLGHFGFVWNKIFKREILERHHIRFDENVKLLEDELFVLRYLAQIDTIYISEKNAEYNYEWPIYTHKYRQTINNIYTQIQLYHLARKVLPTNKDGRYVLSYRFLNKLLFKTIFILAEGEYIDNTCFRDIIQTIQNDIKYVVRRKFLPFKLLSKTCDMWLWKFIFYFYGYLVRWRLLSL